MNQPRVEFFIKRPKDRVRASFAVIRRVWTPSGKRTNETLKLDSITAINKQFRAGVLDQTTADMEIRRIRDELNLEERKKRSGIWVSSEPNRKLLEEYWEKDYADREIRRPETAKNRLRWGVDQIGPVSVLASRHVLIKAVDLRCVGNPRKHRRLCKVLNQIRRYYGVKERLRLRKNVLPEFKYLTESEFIEVLKHVRSPNPGEVSDETLKSFYTLKFYGGFRTGEGFGLDETHLTNPKWPFISRQRLRDGTIGPTKNEVEHRTYLFPAGRNALVAWINAEDRENIDRTRLSKIIKSACQKAFPSRKDKWICAHDLRHSYAYHFLTQKMGATITLLAKLIGDSVSTTERYYARFVIQPEDMGAHPIFNE